MRCLQLFAGFVRLDIQEHVFVVQVVCCRLHFQFIFALFANGYYLQNGRRDERERTVRLDDHPRVDGELVCGDGPEQGSGSGQSLREGDVRRVRGQSGAFHRRADRRNGIAGLVEAVDVVRKVG